jgi:hypothetical protein
VTKSLRVVLLGLYVLTVPYLSGDPELARSIAYGQSSAMTAHANDSVEPGVVYVVHAVDAECWWLNGGVFQQVFDLSDYQPGGKIDQVTQEQFRLSNVDSFGEGLKLSWFLTTQEPYFHSAHNDPGIVLTSMKPYWSRAESLGDCFGWHYHHADWADMNGDSIFFWNQLTTFDGTEYTHGADVDLAEKMLSYLVLEHRFYPVVFRSGWLWENTDFSNWLDAIVPFDFSNIAPEKREATTNDAWGNIYDWSRAPADWSFYHPSSVDYQSPGDLKRTVFRCYASDLEYEPAFARALAGDTVMVCMGIHSFSHLPAFAPTKKLRELARLYAPVKFKFVNALEGAKLMLGCDDHTAPQVTVARRWDTITVVSNEPLFSFPYCAVETIDNNYVRLLPMSSTTEDICEVTQWTFDLSSIDYLRFTFGGTAPCGNSFVSEVYEKLDTGSVVGHVTQRSNGILGIEVELQNGENQTVGATVTGSGGEFSFAGVPNGLYRVKAYTPTTSVVHTSGNLSVRGCQVYTRLELDS